MSKSAKACLRAAGLLSLLALLVLPRSASAAEGSPRWSISSRSFPRSSKNVTVNLPTGFTADPSLAPEYGRS